MIVVDASVALKWFFEEQAVAAADDLLINHSGQMRVPDVFVSEVLGALVREANADKVRAPEIRRLIAQFFVLQRENKFTVLSMMAAYPRVTDIAIEMGHPIKDCIYLALAEALEAPLITADVRFANKARLVYPEVRILGE
jgi:predicted nucleic acid-binding protein